MLYGGAHCSSDHEDLPMKMPKNLGMLLLAIWLILFALFFYAPSLGFTFAHSGHVLAVLAAVVGVLLLIQR